jgi:hypothetical protein
VRLAGFGYGEQAEMVNRSLYQDMLIAHWVKRPPEPSRNSAISSPECQRMCAA